MKVDPQHFLGYGYDRDTAATVQSNYAFTMSRTGQNAAAFPDVKTVKLAGFMWPEVQEAMARTLYAWVEPAGRGNVSCLRTIRTSARHSSRRCGCSSTRCSSGRRLRDGSS